jgi:hypothetical protein
MRCSHSWTGESRTPEATTGSPDVFTDLVKWFNLLAAVVPHQELAFYDACALKVAL